MAQEHIRLAQRQKRLEQRSITTLAKDRVKVIDVYPFHLDKPILYPLVSYLTPLDQKNEWSTEGANDQWGAVLLYSIMDLKVVFKGDLQSMDEQSEKFMLLESNHRVLEDLYLCSCR
jgi:hypothetical protein